MPSRVAPLAIALTFVASLAAVPTLYANAQSDKPKDSETMDHQGMMGQDGMMGGEGMMGMMGMMEQMSEMMGLCNKMMQSAMNDQDSKQPDQQ